ncbi:hypothetical protein TNCV_1250821 [Trichonephila clavipes]|nr:hypothetical protein TNCV_1250821 [Trichonephila clavipes]
MLSSGRKKYEDYQEINCLAAAEFEYGIQIEFSNHPKVFGQILESGIGSPSENLRTLTRPSERSKPQIKPFIDNQAKREISFFPFVQVRTLPGRRIVPPWLKRERCFGVNTDIALLI